MKFKKKNDNLCKNNISFLKYLHSISNSKRKKLINSIASKKEIDSILEIFLNFLENNLVCKNSFITSMKKNNKYFYKLMNKSNSLRKKKKLLTSPKGGFLMSSILAIAIPILAKLFSHNK